MPPNGPKPIASAGCDTTLFLCTKFTFQIKMYTQARVGLVISVANPGGGPGAWAPPPLEMLKV